MPDRDPQTIVLSRQSILLVTAVSVGLLTLCYVLGVQVGKQSAALRNTAIRGSGEGLQALPASIDDQLKALQDSDAAGSDGTKPVGSRKPEPRPAEPRPPASEPAPEARWTLQLVSTSDEAEARRIAAKAKTAGYPTLTVKERGAFKVRLAKSVPKGEIDALDAKLKGKGFKTYPVKVE